jgi:hypothetical protein
MGGITKNQGITTEVPGSNFRKYFRNLAILMGIVGLLFASTIGQIIYAIGMISVIGIPIALVVEAIPTFALVIVIGYLLWRFIPPFNGWTPAISVAAACLLLLGIPPLHNAEITARVAALTRGNVGSSAGPGNLPVKENQTLALVSRQSRASLCDPICLHLLMSGEAARVLMAPLKDAQAEPDPAMRAYRYSLDRRADCPKPKIAGAGVRTHAQHFREKTPGTISGRYATMLEQGYCLDIAEAKLGEADLAFLAVHGRDFPFPSTISPIAARATASRAGVYAPTGKGEMAPLWQQTSVSYSLLGPVLMSRIKIHPGMSGTSVDWWRNDFKTGQPTFRSLSELIRATGIILPAEVR